ncbi:hypothetical protein [Paracidobacterium acidisoli]|uniref:Uncharacterized protein n=1 Tax=Paracidobacterium acidisoli TaxID=2303751 RepID=A0A372IPT7_9BACT|nr:hypothetical protein [Paracidobacterium acidisoli]MBT9331251.1 hypothetical protein [Paracidobacterium acidisoli]
MTPLFETIRELAAWGFDSEADRGDTTPAALEEIGRRAQAVIAARTCWHTESPILAEETSHLADALSLRGESIAASGEFRGLDWELAVVDLRRLLAFQRRIEVCGNGTLPWNSDASWERRLDLALPHAAAPSPQFSVRRSSPHAMQIETLSPNATVRLHCADEAGQQMPHFVFGAGSPYMEAAAYRGRWFLRDGYHRSVALLRSGISQVPVVMVHARLLAELGAGKSWFFPEETLFSEQPPRLADFIEESLTCCYTRRVQQRGWRISLEEYREPVTMTPGSKGARA